MGPEYGILCKSLDAWNFEVAPSFLENLFIPGIDYASFCCGTLWYAKLTSFIPSTKGGQYCKNLIHVGCFTGPVLPTFFFSRKSTGCTAQSITDEGSYAERCFSEFLIIHC